MALDNTRVHDEELQAALDKKYWDLGGDNANAWNLVARSLGVYPSYVSAVKGGKRLPSPSFLKKLGLCRVITFERIDHQNGA